MFFLSLIAIFVLAGCSKEENSSEVPELLEVVVKTPKTMKVNEEVVFEALVTQGEDKVEDTKKVESKIKKSDQETREKIIGNHQSAGIYSISKTFHEVGDYTVIAHVTARDMPKKGLKVVASE